MIYGSVCSGIEAASIAWHPLGWRAAFFSEIEPFPCAVLRERFPAVPLHGDFTTIQPGDYEPIELLVGGTPCQDFSVAGLRAGLAGERGKLTIEFVHLARRLRPRWLVWENVPGVLSADKGQAFGLFLGLLAECGYGFAYRVLDAQHFGVPQRRRRVFVVGYLGDWRPAAAVLFEPESLFGDSPPRREAGQGTPVGAPCGAVSSKWAKGTGGPAGDEAYNLIAADYAPPVTSNPYGDHESREGLLVAHSLRADGFDASEDGTGRGTPLVAFSSKDHGADCGDLAPTLRAMEHNGSHANAGGQVAVAFEPRMRGDDGRGYGRAPHFSAESPSINTVKPPAIASAMSVRRLTPAECEKLQGFPPEFTAINYRGKPAADGPRYRSLGNSMAVPCMRWIGERIDFIEALIKARP